MMHASVKKIDPTQNPPKIDVYWNSPEVNIICEPKIASKYKKVGINQKIKLISLVQTGSSIISAAKLLKINYSTAKSIFQNRKARNHRKMKRKSFVPINSEDQEDTTRKDNEQQES